MQQLKIIIDPCYNAVDSIVQALMTRFDQPSFKAFCAMEQLLLKGIEGQDVSAETAVVQEIIRLRYKFRFA